MKNYTADSFNIIKQAGAAGQLRSAAFLEVCFFNYFSGFSSENTSGLVRMLEQEKISYSLSFLDMQQTENVNEICSAFPGMRILLPLGARHFSDSINLFFKESRSEYLLFLPCEMQVQKFNLPRIFSMMQHNLPGGAIPLVCDAENKPVATIYAPALEHKRFFLSKGEFRPGLLTLLPYKLAFLCKKEHFIGSGFNNIFSNMLVAILDVFYRLYSRGKCIVAADSFIVKENNTAARFNEFRAEAHGKSDLELFYYKNITDHDLENGFFSAFLSVLAAGGSFKKLIKLHAEKSDTKNSRVLCDRDILELFKKNA